MEKKTILFIILGIILLMLIPIPNRIKDGGSIEYKAILYKITKVHRLNEFSPTGYDNGLIIDILSKNIYNKVEKHESTETIDPIDPTITNNDFEYDMIHLVNKETDNYIFSPYSIAYALSILKDGASGNTKEQIEKVLSSYKLDTMINIKDRISTANALFIKNKYTNDISKNYTDTIKNNYNAEILFDELKTPKIINDWASNHTYGMIENVVDKTDEDFVLGIINALAIDVEWERQFNNKETNKQEFTTINNQKVNVDMMHTGEANYYIENDKAKGIIRNYKKYDNTELQFIAILPNENIQEYINNFDKEELNSLMSNIKEINSKRDIKLSIPKFTIDYNYKEFKNDLIRLGIIDAFNKNNADFKKMINDTSNLSLYVNEAVHKAHIEFTEYGTKAAAVTYFGMFKATAMPTEKEIINIVFDRPFLYIIKDKNSDNIWFFGTVYNL